MNNIVGLNRPVRAAVVWDPDGSGPANRLLVLGGEFDQAGAQAARRIVTYDRTTGDWAPLGTGFTQPIKALAVLPNGELVAGGQGLAAWRGNQWVPLANAPTNGIESMIVTPDGDLIVGGNFISCGPLTVNGVARWNGTSWFAYGPGLVTVGTNYAVRALAVMPNGDLVAGGNFPSKLARWNGSSWSQVGGGVACSYNADARISALLPQPNGDLLVGGRFDSAGGKRASLCASWNGTSWSVLGSGLQGNLSVIGPEVTCLARRANGNTLVLGDFDMAGGQWARGIAEWDGNAWSGVDGPYWRVRSVHGVIEEPNGDLHLFGDLTVMGPAAFDIRNGARWDGTSMQPLGRGIGGSFLAALGMRDGRVLAGGWFAGDGVTNLAVWSAGSWSGLGQPPDDRVTALLELSNGDVIAGGSFSQIGGVSAQGVARCNGTSWSAMGVGLAGETLQFVELPDGSVVARGSFWSAFGLSRWDGTSWTALTSGWPFPFHYFGAMVVTAEGRLVVSCQDQVNPQAAVMMWDGVTWQQLGMHFQGPTTAWVTSLLARLDGSILASGQFASVGSTNFYEPALWNGSAWVPASGLPTPGAYCELPQGDVAVIHSNGPGNGIHRWDGSIAVPWGPVFDNSVVQSTMNEHGLVVRGAFDRVADPSGEIWSPGIVRLRATCAGGAQSIGTGGTSSAGPLVLTEQGLPWLRGTFRSTCRGIPASASAFALMSLTSPAVPLSSLHPAGAPGVLLLANPDDVDVLAPQAGRVTAQCLVPGSTALIGAVCYQQVVVFEHGSGTSVTSINASNGLRLTLGDF